MPPAAIRRVVVMGLHADAVGEQVRRWRESGARAAGFVGDDERLAREMGREMLGGVDEVVTLVAPGGGEAGEG